MTAAAACVTGAAPSRSSVPARPAFEDADNRPAPGSGSRGSRSVAESERGEGIGWPVGGEVSVPSAATVEADSAGGAAAAASAAPVATVGARTIPLGRSDEPDSATGGGGERLTQSRDRRGGAGPPRSSPPKIGYAGAEQVACSELGSRTINIVATADELRLTVDRAGEEEQRARAVDVLLARHSSIAAEQSAADASAPTPPAGQHAPDPCR